MMKSRLSKLCIRKLGKAVLGFRCFALIGVVVQMKIPAAQWLIVIRKSCLHLKSQSN